MKVHKVVELATHAEAGLKAPMPYLELAQSVTQSQGCKLEVRLKNAKTISCSVPRNIAFEIVKQIGRLESSGWQPEAKLPTSLGDMLALKEKRPELFELIDEQSFMRAIAEAFIGQRFDVRYRRDSQEFGFDFLIRDRFRQCMVVQVKKKDLNSTISISAVQKLLGAAQTFEDTGALLICPSGFTDAARGFASRQSRSIQLWTTTELAHFSKANFRGRLEGLLSTRRGGLNKVGQVQRKGATNHGK
jgi:hypothetical protein